MKRLIILISFLIVSLNCFSQADTKTVCLPSKVAKQAAKELVLYDGCVAENDLLSTVVNKLEERDENKDTIIELLNGKDEKAIDNEVKGLKRINKNISPELSTKLKHQVIAINGEEDKKTIRDFVDNYFLAKDSAAFRTHIKQTSPDIKMNFIHNGANGEEEVAIPLQIQFFWPDARV